MSKPSLDELLKLPIADRVRLVERLWDSIAATAGVVPLTPEQRADLERRLAEYEANPEEGAPWNEVRDRIEGR